MSKRAKYASNRRTGAITSIFVRMQLKMATVYEAADRSAEMICVSILKVFKFSVRVLKIVGDYCCLVSWAAVEQDLYCAGCAG